MGYKYYYTTEISLYFFYNLAHRESKTECDKNITTLQKYRSIFFYNLAHRESKTEWDKNITTLQKYRSIFFYYSNTS